MNKRFPTCRAFIKLLSNIIFLIFTDRMGMDYRMRVLTTVDEILSAMNLLMILKVCAICKAQPTILTSIDCVFRLILLILLVLFIWLILLRLFLPRLYLPRPIKAYALNNRVSKELPTMEFFSGIDFLMCTKLFNGGKAFPTLFTFIAHLLLSITRLCLLFGVTHQ